VTDHLAIDVQGVRRAIDLAIFHENPRAGEHPTEKIRGGGLVGSDDGHPGEDHD